ncbi:hypothetical protein EKK58_10230 [Candidatus Dependentiae bacterium]|nr:MAG: hypothetical protein EKK58_10230 [Candidatus Dependentiae bacterium]
MTAQQRFNERTAAKRKKPSKLSQISLISEKNPLSMTGHVTLKKTKKHSILGKMAGGVNGRAL